MAGTKARLAYAKRIAKRHKSDLTNPSQKRLVFGVNE